MSIRIRRATSVAAVGVLIGAALVGTNPATASTAAGGLVEVTYSGYNDAATTHRLSAMPEKNLSEVTSADMPSIVVDPSVKYQTWEGFGGSLEDATVYNLNRLSTANRDAALNDLFDPVSGNGFSLMRVPIGCSDFCRDAPNYWTYDDNGGVADPLLENFSVQRDIDNGLIEMLGDITAINPTTRFYASMWSPPAWMKTNSSLVGPEEWGACDQEDAPRVHHGVSTGSNVDYYPILADYYVRYIEAYEELGVPIYAVTLQNEPDISMPYPSTCFTPAQLADFAVELGSAFSSAGIDALIWGLDGNEQGTFPYSDALLGDPAVVDYVDGLGWHNYGGTAVWQPTAVIGAYAGKTAHVTEISNGAARLIEYFRNAVSSYSYWVTMYEFSPGPSPSFWGDKPRDPATDPDFYSPSIVSFLDGDPTNYQLNGWYYSFGQFSRYIQTGAHRIDSSEIVSDTVSNVAFENPDGTIVIIATNRGNSPYNSALTNPAPATVRFVTPSGEFRDTLPGDTIATYVVTPTTGAEASVVAASASAAREGNAAFQAIDGDSATFWTTGANQAAGQAFTLDLGDVRTVDQLTLTHGTLSGDFAAAYELKASTDGVTWGSPVASGSGTRDITNITFDKVNARYLQVSLTTGAPRWWSVAEATAYDSTTGLLDGSSMSAVASATNGAEVADRALDGTATSRWSSGEAQQPGQNFTIDLGDSRLVTAIELDSGSWVGDEPRGWEVQASDDGVSWGPVLASGLGSPGATRIAIAPSPAQYWRITQTGTAANNFWTIAEARVYGTSAELPAIEDVPLDRAGWSATASNAGPTGAGEALDGLLDTRWASGAAQSGNEWFQVDLGAVETFSAVQLNAAGPPDWADQLARTYRGDFARGYEVYVSSGDSWTLVASGAGDSAADFIRFPEQTARYINVHQTGTSAYWWGIAEFYAYE
ncbi:O-glycosyl hydrolase [Microbacterium halimionae]|uniref:O-glycosyl hydrolase n=1 Tax=Microbacterium halimionae TaxID=1526413 RepID=A0A7W3PMP7_9MICO|nr:discoidin domain-containing protein [Microbacterium halimionae]MBA8817182.1 O-glycosyl hydrolase [Microbacterium halimionae]NII94632.1 O-glycosyl hydrolase [Microbacterium halimionae]